MINNKKLNDYYFDIMFKITIFKLDTKENGIFDIPPFNESSEFYYYKKVSQDKIIECQLYDTIGKYTVSYLAKNIKHGILIKEGKFNDKIGYKISIQNITKRLYVTKF